MNLFKKKPKYMKTLNGDWSDKAYRSLCLLYENAALKVNQTGYTKEQIEDLMLEVIDQAAQIAWDDRSPYGGSYGPFTSFTTRTIDGRDVPPEKAAAFDKMMESMEEHCEEFAAALDRETDEMLKGE
jgi:predicted dehydrogenase